MSKTIFHYEGSNHPSNTLIAAYDFDAWDYKLREWKSGDDAKYRFTGKERDFYI